MEAFEQIVARVFDRDGYWIKQSYKVDVTKEEKRLIGTHSMPRVEIDLLAFRAIENVVHVIECKSYLRLGLVTGKVRRGERESLQALFQERGWNLWDDNWVANRLKEFSENLYENSVVDMTVKLIRRAE